MIFPTFTGIAEYRVQVFSCRRLDFMEAESGGQWTTHFQVGASRHGDRFNPLPIYDFPLAKQETLNVGSGKCV